MKCDTCGVALKAGAKFCGNCGAPIAVEESNGVRCPKCGTTNRPDAKFCRQDGTPLVGESVPAENRRPWPAATPPRPETAATSSAPPPRPTPPPRPVQLDAATGAVSAGAQKRWLVIAALAVLAAAGGGYWLYMQRGAPSDAAIEEQTPVVADVPAQPADEPASEVVQAPPAAPATEVPRTAQGQSAQAPELQVGDRWVTEVIDHQDAKLNYRSERVVIGVGPAGIVTSVRTIGKDYTRVVDYDRHWGLTATHLPSGSTTVYVPALPYLKFPLQPGDAWQAKVTETDAEGKRRLHDANVKVEAWETVTVPAGSFRALKVVLTDNISKDGVLVQQGQDVSWYVPDVRRTVKTEETSFDPATGETRRRTVSLVEYAVQGGGSAGADGYTATQAPPAEVVSNGACPFEGCQLGEWTAREPAVLYDRPNGVQTRTILAGDRVVATEAQVRAQPHRAIVTSVYQTDQQQGIHVGDVAFALYPLGEGAVAVWHDGRVKEGSLDLRLRFDDKTESTELNYVWWVHVKLPDGTMGWIKDPRGFDGMDALG